MKGNGETQALYSAMIFCKKRGAKQMEPEENESDFSLADSLNGF